MAPVVVVCDGRSMRYRPHPGLSAAAVRKDVKESWGYQGHLEHDGCKITDDFVLVEGETYSFVKKEGPSWLEIHDQMPSASTLAAIAAQIRRYLGREEPVYDLGRVSAAIPLELTVDAFGAYVAAFKCRDRELSLPDWDFVCNVMDMSGFFEDEKQREVMFGQHLEAYLISACPGMDIRYTYSVKGRSMPNIRVEVKIDGEWITVAFVEVKVELVGAETSIELMKYYGDHTKLLWEQGHWSYQFSCCPVPMVELAGPHIRVGGAASYLDRPAYQPFTPFLHIYKFLQDAQHMATLSRSLATIGEAISKLVVFYDDLSLTSKQLPPRPLRGPELEWPCVIRTLQHQGATIIQSTRPQPVSTLRLMNIGQAKQLLFGVEQPGVGRRAIKFCQRYGIDVHQSWAADGYAPQFTHASLPGGWFMIDMEFLSKEDGWLPLIALDPRAVVRGNPEANRDRLQPQAWEVCKSKVVEAYKALRQKYPLVVHGDLRKGNVLYNLGTSGVAFVDFDWAGFQGRDIYPPLINMRINWPIGVGPCKPMTVDNDWQLLANELGVQLD